jgi:(p)ppGpp synthase/HD superfamily hydrolase
MQINTAPLIESALTLALQTHLGQRDRHGAAYILHPLRVGLRARNDIEMIAGFLHDVVEDSPDHGEQAVTLDTLREMGYPEDVVVIVDHLTKRKIDGEDEPWSAYLERVMQNEAAMHLKLLDLEQNMDTTRISHFNNRDAERFARYVEAWHAIRERLGME